MFQNIPLELRAYPQWIVWKLVERVGTKPTKIPIDAKSGQAASVTDPSTWTTFENAVAAAQSYSGIGFVFADSDPFCGIDLDDTHGDADAFARQKRVFEEFASYSELSPSGNGLHIIVKGGVPQGRRRSFIEVYSRERFFTVTGSVINNRPIEPRQELLSLLWEQMGGAPTKPIYAEDQPQRHDDTEIIAQASNASNGDKFQILFEGHWQGYYASQSEADFALVDIIAFYTQNREQIARIFRASALGQRDKAKRDQYIAYMVEKSFDRQLPQVDIEGLRIQFAAKLAAMGGGAAKPGGNTAPPDAQLPAEGNTDASANPASHGPEEPSIIFPPGLLGEVAQYILDQAPRPVPQIALAGAIGLLSGITGRAYNISGVGLNQYIIVLARTGTGKDAIADGISKLMEQVSKTVPASTDFKGPGELVSSAGLIKWLQSKPCCFSVVGEIGKKLKEMSSPHANSNVQGIQRILLQMYSKSGKGKVFDPMAYSDKEKNGIHIHSPAYTLIGESVPESFYESLDETLVSDGLLPRFMVFEYVGKRELLAKGADQIQPPIWLVEKVASLTAQCLSLAHNHNVHAVQMTDDAAKLFDEFDRWTTATMNADERVVATELWNRAHIKALKLAAVVAVGINYLNPIVTIEAAQWATDEIVKQTRRLLDKFEQGQIGQQVANEARQIEEVVKCVSLYTKEPFEKYSVYGGTREMHRDGVIMHSHIQRRVISMASFRHDKIGATNAMKRAVESLLQAADLKEINKRQMLERYGRECKAYCIGDPERFV